MKTILETEEETYAEMPAKPTIKTLGELKKSGYQSLTIKQELRKNLVNSLKNSTFPFLSIHGYEDTVLPQLQTAILSQHNIILLGLRGQAKTRIARMMVKLLDEYIPVIAGSELNEDPFNPITRYSLELLEKEKDNTPVDWLHRDMRYSEKLATPDVSVADLVGDLDPIKAASLKLTYADERIIHYGIIPRSNRSIFVINELPDLQARIQVALFNILQEGDMEIRGFKLRLPLDIQFVFTANPEDYTNRGSIVTPLKDRIESQILTHYPKTVDIGKAITRQEINLQSEHKNIHMPELMYSMVEQIAVAARESEYIDQKSGVSARLTISAMENLFSTAERRMLLNNEQKTTVRVSDLFGVIPSITGKVELVYEGEVEGITSVAYNLIGKAIRKEFLNIFPDPEKVKKRKSPNPYNEILQWFSDANELDIMHNITENEYRAKLDCVAGLGEVIMNYVKDIKPGEVHFYSEFLLHGLSEYSQLSKHKLETGVHFKDLLSSMFNINPGEEDEY